MSGKFAKRSDAMRKRWADPIYRAAQVKRLRLLAQDVERNEAIREMRKNESAPLVKNRIRALNKASKKAHQRCKARDYRRKWSWGPTKKSVAMKKLWETKREQMLAGINKSWDKRRRYAQCVAMLDQPRNENSQLHYWVRKEPTKLKKIAPLEVLEIFDQLCERLGCNASASIGFEPKQTHRNDSSAPAIATLAEALCASPAIELEKTSGDYGKTDKKFVSLNKPPKPNRNHPWHQQQQRECANRKVGK